MATEIGDPNDHSPSSSVIVSVAGSLMGWRVESDAVKIVAKSVLKPACDR